VERTAKLIAQWQAVGFNHGVMNTDNMSIHGLTIDYGPYALLDIYDRNNICNQTDAYGRYSFGNQPNVAEWNLRVLMTALASLVPLEQMEAAAEGYGRQYSDHYVSLMCRKLGLERVMEGDIDLVRHLFGALQGLNVDYTLFFRTLSRYDGNRKPLLALGLYHTPMNDWLDAYDVRLKVNEGGQEDRHKGMLKTNPKYALKNYMLQEVVDAAEAGEYKPVDDLFRIAQDPFDEHPEFEHWAGATPEAYRNQKLSCSS
jgi:uncharacterized protein YdiU (UPF0061 family)